MAITRIDPPDYREASTVQIDSDASDSWVALDEVEDWAQAHGFVRTSEYQPRPILVGGRRQFRAICFRLSQEERSAIDQAQIQMTERGKHLRGLVRSTAGDAE